MKKIVSVQDISCYGQCSLTVALPILSSYGIETAIMPSAILSTHTRGFKNFTVLDLTEELFKILNHWVDENIKFDAIYTGYIGDVRQFDLVSQAKERILNKNGLLVVDPAMADNGKLYPALNEEIVLGMRKIVAESDITIPNITEACLLLDVPYRETYDLEFAKGLAYNIAQMGPKKVIITGLTVIKGKISVLCYDKENDEYIYNEENICKKSYHGTGDIFSSVLIAHILNGDSINDAIKKSMIFVIDAINKTMDDDSHNYGVKFEQVLNEK